MLQNLDCYWSEILSPPNCSEKMSPPRSVCGLLLSSSNEQ